MLSGPFCRALMLGASCFGIVTNAQAQSAPTAAAPTAAAPSPASANTGGAGAQPGDIIVTAQRRSERLERTPVAVSVVSSAALATRGIVSEEDLRTAVPGLSVRSTTNSNQLNYAIRGQSVDAYSNNRPGVLPYFNEVQVGGAGGSSGFYDLQSVQILKGPQGTLFGRSATGGAVLFTSQRPEADFGGYLSAAGGDYAHGKFEGALNVPISSVLRARVAGFYETRDGFQQNLYDGKRVGDFNRYGLRGSVDLDLGAFQNKLTVDYSNFRGGSTAAVLSSLVPGAPVPAPLLYAGGATSDATFTGLFLAEGAPPGTNLTGAWAAYAASHPQANANGIAAELASQNARGPFKINQDGPNNFRADNVVVSNASTYALGEDMTIKNIFGYVDVKSDAGFDADGSPFPIDEETGLYNNYQSFSNELQLLGKALDKNLSYVAGAYYSHERQTTLISTNILELPPFVQTPPQLNRFRQEDATYAGYAQATYNLAALGLSGVGVTGGLRYTSERVSNDQLPGDVGYAAALTNPLEAVDQHKTSHNLSWTTGLQYQATSDLLLYASGKRSYKGAGYNGTIAPYVGTGSVGGNGFNEEQVTEIEGGAKFRGTVASLPTRLNLAVYKDFIDNNQRVAYTLAFGAPAAISVNVPRATVTGFEFDGDVILVKWLDVGGTLTYTDGKFTNNVVSVQGIPTVFGTYPDTPKWAGSVYSEATIPLGDALEGTLRGEYYSQSSVYYSSTANLDPGAVLPSYSIANFTVGVKSSQYGWSLTGNVKNAFNRTYYVGGVALGSLLGLNTRIPGEPRTFMIELRKKF